MNDERLLLEYLLLLVPASSTEHLSLLLLVVELLLLLLNVIGVVKPVGLLVKVIVVDVVGHVVSSIPMVANVVILCIMR